MERQQHSDDPQQLDLLRVCRIGRAQGLKGEVTVRLYTDDPDYRFAPGSVLYTRDGSQEYVVERSRTFKDRWIIKFEAIDNRDASEALNGIELYGEADDPELMLEEDAWYPRDLVGLEARMAEDNGLGAGRSGGRQGCGRDRRRAVAAQDPTVRRLSGVAGLGRCACRGRCSFRTFLFAF